MGFQKGFSRGVGRGIGRSISRSPRVATHDVHTNQRTFIVETSLPSLDAVVDALCLALPELERKHFTTDPSGSFTTFQSGSRVVISGKKLLVETLKVSRIASNKYQFEIAYNVKIGAFPIILGLFGLLFGIIPGLIVFFIAFWLKSASSEEIQPVLDRFESIVTDLAVPQLTAITIVPDSSDEATARLKKLEILLKDGQITRTEYDRKREDIISSI
jgi:hypothetical protein